MRQTVPATPPHGRHCRPAGLLGHTAVRRCVPAARVYTHVPEDGARRPGRRSPKQAARLAETLARQEQSCRGVRPLPRNEAAAKDFPDRAGRSAPSKIARLRRGLPPRIAPRLWCTARRLRRDDFVFAAGRRVERCARAAAGCGPPAKTGCKWRALWSRPWAPRTNQKEDRSTPPRGPADPSARTDRRAPAWLPDVAASRRSPPNTPRSRPRRGSSRGSAWRDPNVCLRLRPSVQVAFAVTEICRTGAKQLMVPGCALRRARIALVNYIPPAGSGKT